MPRHKPIDTIPLFGEPDPIERPAPESAAATSASTKPKWAKYRPKNPERCDHCMAYLAESGGSGPLAAQAKFSRTVGKVKELLCYQHAQQQRERDHLPALKGGAK